MANRAVRVYDKTDSFIAVEADYIPADGVQTLKDAVRFNMKASDEPQEVESESKASLGGLKAILVISHYRARGALMLHEQIIALGGRFIYSADLQTTPARRIVDEKLWTEIVRGFRVHQGKL